MFSGWLHSKTLGLHNLFSSSIGVVSHVILPSQKVESDAAPALTAVGEAGKKSVKKGI